MPRRKAVQSFVESVPGHPMGDHVEEFLIPARYEDGIQVSSAIGADGKEYPDPVPAGPPVGYVPPNDLYETIRNMIKSEKLREMAGKEDFDTPEEADDFEVEDDEWLQTPYERHFEPDPKVMTPAAAAPSQIEAPAAALNKAGSSEGQPAAPAAAERSEANTSTKVT